MAATFALPIGPGTSSADFGNTVAAPGVLADAYTFSVPAGTTNGFVGSIAFGAMLDVTITSVLLDSTPFTQVSSGTLDFFQLDPTAISAGPHTLFVNGSYTGTSGGSYAGTLNYVVGAVPEPATWALMIGGFGLVGGTMRRRKTVATFANA